MNIHYIGATASSKYKRFALIQYSEKKEEESAKRFLLLLNQTYSYTSVWEEEMLYISVDDKEEFEYVKECFKTFKKTDMFRKKAKSISHEDMYEEAGSDAEMYCFLVSRGAKEDDIKRIMRNVSGADDAYNNALEEISTELF